MSNLPILYATLGALVGLPVGHWIGYMADPNKLPRRVLSAWACLLAADRDARKTMRAFVIFNPNMGAKS